MKSTNSKKIKNINGMEQIMIDLKPKRSESFVYSNRDLEVTKLVEYIEKKKKENKDITFFHAFVMALAKVIYNRNKLNRFVQNRHIYEHNDIIISFVAKVAFEDDKEEIMIMVPIKEKDNINTISKYIKEKVNSIRNNKHTKKGANNAIDFLGKLPNIIRIPVVGVLKILDSKGILPKTLTKDNLYYSSTIISNLGSIKSNAIHHNITNFGTCSSLVTIGEIKNKEIINESNKKSIIKVCDWGIAFDERVADGFYLIKSLELLQYIFDNPELLENNANEIIDYKKK